MTTPTTFRPEEQPGIEFDSEEGGTARLDYLPTDERQTSNAIEAYEDNRWLSNNPPDPDYLRDVQIWKNPSEQAQVLEREQARMEDSFTHGRAAVQGFVVGVSNAGAGVQRFLGFDEAADATAKAASEGWQLEPNQPLINFASEVGGDDAVERITKEMRSRETFSHQLAGGAGQLGSMVVVGAATGGMGVTTQIVGQGYEGLYQRAKSELTEKHAQDEAAKIFRDPNYVPKGIEELEASINQEAKDMAFRNMPTVIPELILDRITLKQGGKLLRASAGTTVGKTLSVLYAASSEGSSEALTAALQNWMVQRGINPDQELTEDMLRDFALGFILGGGMAGGASLTGGVTDLGLEAILGDVVSLRKEMYIGLVKASNNGDEAAIAMLQEWDASVTRATSLDLGDPIVIASATETVDGAGISKEAVLKAINKKLKARADNLPAVTIVQRAEDITDVDVRSQVVNAGATVEALVVPGQEIILIASNIRDAKRAEEVFDHESIGHEGVDLVTGKIGKYFYAEVARRYGNTKLGQEIIRKYGSDMEIVGRELVANVSENPDSAPSSLKGAVIKLFHKYKPGVASLDVTGDAQVLKAISLAGEVLTNKQASEALKAEKAPSVHVADEDEARFSLSYDNKPSGQDTRITITTKDNERFITKEIQPPSSRVDPSTRGNEFGQAITRTARDHAFGAAVEVKDTQFYTDPGTKLFFAESGDAGIAVTKEGDLVSVFKHPSSKADMKPLLREAAQNSTTLDAFDVGGFLPNLYSDHGFHPVARIPFNREYAPPGWDYEKLGEPDVVLMVRDPAGEAVEHIIHNQNYSEIRDSVPVFEDYDEAVAHQQSIKAKITARVAPEIRFSKAAMLKKGVSQDSTGNLYFEGQPPSEWDQDQFTRFGKAYGVENFGGLSPIKTITDPETGKPVRLPGGTEGTFSYYEMLWLKANQTPIENLGELLHGQITAKLARSLTPKKVDDMELVNRLMFGMLSPNAPLLPNEYAQARLKFTNKAELKAFADLLSAYPADGTKAQQNAWNKKLKNKYGIGSRLEGHIGIGITQKLSNVANMARLFLKNPKFFYKKDGEEWGTYVDRVATQVPGFGTKTASFGGVWQDPANAMISAIDRHMAREFADTVVQDPKLKARFGKALSDKFNAELAKSKKERATYLRRKRKAGDDVNKLARIEEDWAEKLETIVDPSMKKAKNLDDVMAQAASTSPEKFARSLGQAALAAMSARTPKFRVIEKTHSLEYKGNTLSTKSAKALEAKLHATGDFSSKKAVSEYRKANSTVESSSEVNPSVAPEVRLAEWIEEPSKFKIMSEAYAEALKANEAAADRMGIPVFPAQWTLWDRMRLRVEPHEVMFPGLYKLPKMGRGQIQESMEVHKTLGYNRAPLAIKDSGSVDPSRLVYFSKGEPDPNTGDSKFTVRVKADKQFPEEIRKGLDSSYTIQTHQEVLEKVQPWFDRHGDDYVTMGAKVMDLSDPTLEPEERVLIAMRTLKGLSALADSKRASSAGRSKFIKEAESLEDSAIQLATGLSEFGRSMGRAVSMFQEFGQLTAYGLQRLARRQIEASSGAKLKRGRVGLRKTYLGQKFADEVHGLVDAVRKAALGTIDNQFFIQRLTTIFGGKVPGSLGLWGRYSKSAANRIWGAIQRENTGPNVKVKPSLEKFTDALTREIKDSMELTDKKGPRVKRDKWEDLKEALHNPEKYKDVWAGLAKKVYEDIHSQNPTFTQEDLAELQDMLGKFVFDPSDRLMQITVKEEMAALQQNVNELVREHYSTRDTSKAALVKSLMEKLELSSADAGRIAAEISKTYDKTLATESKKQLDTLTDRYTNPKAQKAAKGMERRIVELANLGAFDRADVYNAVAKHVGIKGSYDPAFAAKIKALSERVQTAPEGFQKNDAISALFTAIQNQAGDGAIACILAVRIANLVSGPSTQLINVTSNVMTLLPLTASQLIRARGNPNMIYSMGMNMLRGLFKGRREAASVLLTGKGRAGYELNKYGFDPYLERKTFIGGKVNPYNYLKHVFRSMSAMDLLFRFTQTEFKAAFLAGQEAKKQGLKGKAMRTYIDEALGHSENFRQGAESQASLEGLTGRDFKRRVDEIMESNRSPEIIEGSQHYGLTSTYQNVPEGIVGALASAFAKAAHPHVAPGTQLPPAKKVLSVISQTFVPFIRVVANVQNMIIDFTPVLGHVRAVSHQFGGHRIKDKAPDKTPDMIYDMHTRAFIAEAMTAALAAMLWGGDEEDEERLFNVTAAGPMDRAKQKVWREAGNKPYSITINGKQFGYKETPFGGLLALLGGIRDAEKYGGEDFVPNLKGYAVASGLAYARLMMDQAFFKGVKDFMDMAQADNFAGVAFENFAKNQAKGVVIPNFFSQIDRAIDPTKYTENDLDGLLSTALPWVRLTGQPSLDVWGRVTRYTSEDLPYSLLSRVMEDYEPDPLATLLFSHGVFPSRVKRNQSIRTEYTVGPSHGLGKLDEELTDRERAEDIYLYSEIRGRWLRNELETLLNSDPPAVDLKNPEQVKSLYGDLQRDAGERAKVMVSDMTRAEVRKELKRIKANAVD